MTGSTKAALAASLLALAACGGGGAGNESINAEGAANQSGGANGGATTEAPVPAGNASDANAAAAPAGEGGAALSREYLVGRWTEMDDCAEAATEFRADGSFVFPWGDTGRWTLTGNRLSLSSNTDALQLRAIDRDTLEVTSPGRTYRSTRCG